MPTVGYVCKMTSTIKSDLGTTVSVMHGSNV